LRAENPELNRPRLVHADYAADPAGFFRDVLGFTAWAKQLEIAHAVATHRRVAVRSGHKVGKSTIAAAVALWWVCTRPRGRVIMTSSVARQVRSILWRELRNLCRNARRPVGATPALDPNTGLRFEDGREVLGFTTDDAESMAGFSGDQILFIVDEASGFPQEIYEAVQGNTAGGGAILAIGNPTRDSGFFFDAFRYGRGGWHLIHISSLESPNVVEGRMVIPGLAGLEWVEEMRAEYGEASPIYAVRVKGDFAERSNDSVIGLALVEAARTAWDGTSSRIGPLEIGVDVARFGDDDSVIQPRRGNHAYRPTVVHGFDTVQVAGRVAEVAMSLSGSAAEGKPIIRVDVIGYGAGVVDVLRRDGRFHVVAVNVGESARDKEKFTSLRDEVWWAARKWLEGGGTLPPEPRLEADLLAPRYSYDARGRVKVEGKPEIKKRLGRSPDRADALCLAVCGVAKMASLGVTTGEGSEADRLASII
jgi:hypothetical protein